MHLSLPLIGIIGLCVFVIILIIQFLMSDYEDTMPESPDGNDTFGLKRRSVDGKFAKADRLYAVDVTTTRQAYLELKDIIEQLHFMFTSNSQLARECCIVYFNTHRHKLNLNTAKSRLRSGWTVEETICTPALKR